MLERVKKINSFPLVIKKRVGKKVGWQALPINPRKSDNLNSARKFVKGIWSTFKYLYISDLRWFLRKSTAERKTVKHIMDDGTMLQIEGVSPTKIFC